MKIVIIGTGYVGLSNAILLAQHNEVIAVDILQNKVDMINRSESPVLDNEIAEYLRNKKLNLIATTDCDNALSGADYVVIATPTDYDPVKKCFDTTSVENAFENELRVNPTAIIIIKSTIPVGYTKSLRKNIV